MLNFLENQYVVAIARTALVLIYFMGGFSLLTGDAPVEYAATKGVPAIAVYLGYAIKLFGGLAVIIGFQTRIAALLLVVFTLGTATKCIRVRQPSCRPWTYAARKLIGLTWHNGCFTRTIH